MTFRFFSALAFLLMLPLCAGLCSPDTPEDTDAYSEGGFTPPDNSNPPDTNDFVEACLASLNWDRALCECADSLSREEIAPVSRELVIAGMNEDEATAERLRSTMSFEEATQAGLFMIQAGRTCGAGGA